MTTIRRYPRTLQEAFGPHTSSHITVNAPASPLWVRVLYGVLLGAVIVGLFSLSGCSQPLTTEQLVADVQKCIDADLQPHYYSDRWTWDYLPTHVICGPEHRQ